MRMGKESNSAYNGQHTKYGPISIKYSDAQKDNNQPMYVCVWIKVNEILSLSVFFLVRPLQVLFPTTLKFQNIMRKIGFPFSSFTPFANQEAL